MKINLSFVNWNNIFLSRDLRFLGGVPGGSPTSIGGFVWCVCDVCVSPKKESYRVEYSTLQTSTEARLTSEVEHRQLSISTMSLQYCSAWPKPGTPPTLQCCNFSHKEHLKLFKFLYWNCNDHYNSEIWTQSLPF